MSLILDLVFPINCFGCGRNGSYFCAECFKNIPISSCKFHDDIVCEGSLSIFKYQSILKKALKEFKYNFVSDLASEISKYCADCLQTNFPNLVSYWQKNDFILIPIPLHDSRLNWRGFNQTSLIGKTIAQGLNLKFNDQILKRSKNTQSQAKFKYKSSRLKNTENAFCLDINKQEKSLQNIILFDDVLTTGSTLNSAFKAFKTYGLNHCWNLTVAG